VRRLVAAFKGEIHFAFGNAKMHFDARE